MSDHPDRITVDLDDLSADEIDTIEEIIDGPLDEAFGPGKRRAPLMRALALVHLRRGDPSATLEQAGKVRVSLGGDDAEESPT